MAREELALFPLGTVLLPAGRMSLQIFEQRYLSLVSEVLKNDARFGIVLLTEGAEVARPGASTRLAEVGVSARIVDWDTLPNGLLGLVVEGEQRFDIHSTRQQGDGLWLAEVDYWSGEPRRELPQGRTDWNALLQQLAKHPHVKRLGMKLESEDAGRLANQLAQLLPIAETDRYRLMITDDAFERLDRIHDLLAAFED